MSVGVESRSGDKKEGDENNLGKSSDDKRGRQAEGGGAVPEGK